MTAFIPAGRGGLNLSQNAEEVPITDLTRAEGIVMEDRVWRKEPGAVSFDAGITGAPSIVAGFDWWPDASTQRIVTAALDGKLYKEVGGDLDAVTLVSGLSTSARGQLVAGGQETVGNARKLFYLNGVDSVRVLSGDGATVSVVATPPADWSGTNQPLCGVIHGPRLYAFGNLNDPHRLYGSGTENHENFTCAGSVTLACYPGVGRRLVAGVSFKGLLWLLKYPRGIFWLDDSDTRLVNWQLRQHTEGVGAAESPYAALSIDDDVLFLAADGSFHLLSATTTGGARDSDLSMALQIDKWLRDNLNLSRLNQVRSCWYGQKKLALFSLPKAGSTVNDLRLMFDFSDVAAGGKVKFSYSFRDVAEALFLRRDSGTIDRPMFGDNAGKVWKMDQATRSKDGAGYAGEYEIAETDFGFLNPDFVRRRKNFSELQLLVNTTGNWNVTVEARIDGTLTETLTFSMNQRRPKRRLRGSGYKLSLRVKTTGAGEDFSIRGQIVSFTPDGYKP